MNSMQSRIIKSELLLPPLAEKSLSRLLFQSLSEFPNKTSIIDTTVDRRWTRSQVLEAALNFAAYLRDNCSLATGDVVFFVSETSDIHAIGIIGVLLAGGVYSSSPYPSAEREILELIQLIKPRVLVSNLKLKMCSEVICIENIETILKRKPLEADPRFPWLQNSDSTATLVLSSGSTGCPKAIKRSNRNILATISMFGHQEMQPLTEEDILLSAGFCHICGQRNLFSAIGGGAQLAVVRNDESHEEVFESINKYGVTTAILIPTQLNWLVKNNWPKDKLSSLQDVVTGAASLSTELHQSIERMYGFRKFRNSYGMSECGFVLLVPNSASIPKRDTLGKVAPGCHIKVIDVNGNPLPAGQVGEICLKSDQSTTGYLRADITNLFTSDGFVRSGDLGFYDSDHFFYFVSRVKDIIKVDGYLVAPAELEHLLLSHKDVTSAAVIGIDDHERGQVPMAFVTLSEECTEEELIAWVDARVNDFKKLRGGLKVLRVLPRTHSGKIRKSSLLTSALI